MSVRERIDGARRDLAYAWRGLRRQPGFTIAAVITVALCVGANTAIFGVVDSVLLQPLPYARADRLVVVWNHWTNWPQTWLSQPEAYDYAAQTQAFSSFAAYAEGAANLTGDAEPERVHVGLVARSFLPTVGVAPVLGRNFTAEEDQPNGPEAALLDYGLWQRRYGGDRSILGRRIAVNGVPTTVVGVLPRGFRLPDEFAGEHSEVYRPLRLGPADETQRGGHYLLAVARLAPGVTAAGADARLGAYIERYKREHPQRYGPDFGASLVPIPDQVLGSARRVLVLLLIAVGFVLLIGCANVASLLLSRAEARQREIAVRAALGASRARLARQFLLESLLLGLLGAALAFPLAAWGGAVLARIGSHDLPRGAATTANAATLAFTLAAAVLASVLFGLAPAVHSLRGDLQSPLRSGRSSGDRRGLRLRQLIVTAQIVLAVVSVAGAALMTRSFAALLAVPAGFHPDHVLTMRLSLPQTRYPKIGDVRQFYSDVLMRVRALPGVRAAGAINALPLASTIGDWGVDIAGHPEPPRSSGQNFAFDWQVATPGYFQAMGIPILRGRAFTDADTRDAQPVMIVSEATARKFWPPSGDSAIGARVRLGGTSDSLWRTVVGIAGDVHHAGLEKAVRTEMYLPHAQFPSTDGESASGALTGMTLVIRSAGDPAALARSVRGVIHEMDALLPVAQVRPLADVVEESVSTPRFATLLLGAFGVLALVLSAVGVYGVMAYSVARRTNEIGIRMALGARAADVLALVVRQGMRPALIGLVVGSAAALLSARFMRGLVFGVRPTDALSLGVAVAVLALVAVAATALAARRVTRVDPSTALRSD